MKQSRVRDTVGVDHLPRALQDFEDECQHSRLVPMKVGVSDSVSDNSLRTSRNACILLKLYQNLLSAKERRCPERAVHGKNDHNALAFQNRPHIKNVGSWDAHLRKQWYEQSWDMEYVFE